MSTVIAEYVNQNLNFTLDDNHESRGISVSSLIRRCVYNFDIKQNFVLKIWTGDKPNNDYYSFSTINKDYSKTFPCFVYDSWPEVGIDDYQKLIIANSFISDHPNSNKIGWIGLPMSLPRQIYMSNFSNTYFSEGITNIWNQTDPKNLYKHTNTFMTFAEQIKKWKYLIDFEGQGYSARLKILLNSPRIIFVVDRPYKEWFYEHMVPWTHFIPVKRDLSNLEENYHKIESDPALQSFILEEQRKFSKKYLHHNSAINHINNIILKNHI